MHSKNARFKLATLILGLVSIPAAQGQVAPSVSKGNIELGIFGGESYGIDRFRPMFGGDVAYGATRALYPFIEASYLPGLARTFDVGNGGTSNYKINATDVEGGLHLRLVKGGWRAVPYVAAGGGLVHTDASTYQAYSRIQTGALVPSGQGTIDPHSSFAVNFGGGLRVFLTERIGIRVEFKAFAPTSSPTGVSNTLFYRMAIGPVFQVR